jgi:hypothetical protein
MEGNKQNFENKKRVEDYITKIDSFREKMATYKRDDLIENVLPANTTDMLVGPPKAKKSFIAITLAGAIASGQPWLGKFPVKQKPVLYLNLEVAPEYFREMLDKALGPDYTGDFYVAHRNFNSPFRFMVSEFKKTKRVDDKDGGSILSGVHSTSIEGDSKFLVELKKQVPDVGLVVIDSFRRSTSINENDSGEVSRYFDAINRLRTELWDRATILIVHHSTKSPSNTNDPLKTVRGSGDLLASIDNLFQVIPQNKVSSREREILTFRTDYGRIRLNSNDYATGIDIGAFDSVDNQGMKRLYFNYIGIAYEGATAAEKAMNMIREMLKQKGYHYNEIIEEIMKRNLSRSTAKNAIDKLVEDEEIKKTSDLYELSEQ